jgi:hypothetical protein
MSHPATVKYESTKTKEISAGSISFDGASGSMSSALEVISVPFPATPLAAGTSTWAVAPVAGSIVRVQTVVTTTLDAATTVALQLGGVAVTGGDVATAGTLVAGTVNVNTPTALNVVGLGDAIEITSDAGCSSGDVNVLITIQRSS